MASTDSLMSLVTINLSSQHLLLTSRSVKWFYFINPQLQHLTYLVYKFSELWINVAVSILFTFIYCVCVCVWWGGDGYMFITI